MTPDNRLLAELRRYYESKGIGAISFRCPHFAQCRSLSLKFTTAQETYVGPRYADGTHPRLLFLSLDSPTLEAAAIERTLERVRTRTLTWDIRKFHKGYQWFQTNDMARRLLCHFVPGLVIETAVRYFAHANSAKCSVHNPDRRQAPALLFDNCLEFIPGELRILRPDILVTQGQYAKRIAQAFSLVEDVGKKSGCDQCQARVIRIGSQRETIWLHCHHTSARGGLFLKQMRQCWSHYEQAVVEFLGRGNATFAESNQPARIPPPQVPSPGAEIVPQGPKGDDVFVWVNSCDQGWVIHGRARSHAGRARDVAEILRRDWGWQTVAGGSRPATKSPQPGAPPANVAMRSPASPAWRG